MWRTERALVGTEFPDAAVKVALLGGHYEPMDADEEAIFAVVQVS